MSVIFRVYSIACNVTALRSPYVSDAISFVLRVSWSFYDIQQKYLKNIEEKNSDIDGDTFLIVDVDAL